MNNRYVIRVTGDSMEPRIQDGDLILVDYGTAPRFRCGKALLQLL
jgi:phage repressor protein C with HTH and peptisase S24 domain